MANEFRKVTDQNGVNHPVCDDTRVDWASYAKTGAINYLNAPNKTVTGSDNFINDNTPISLKAGTYKFSFDVTGTISSGREYVLNNRTSGTVGLVTSKLKSGHNEVIFTTATDITKVQAYENETTNELTFSNFMIADAYYNGDYVPYAMTNMEVTDMLAIKESIALQDPSTASNITLDSSLNWVLKQGNVVNFTVRFTLAEASTTGDYYVFKLPYEPKKVYPMFTVMDRNAPYGYKCGAYLNPGGSMGISGIALPAGTYQMSGIYICK